ncbi:ATP-binding protein, partial [Thermococcus sp. GR7]
ATSISGIAGYLNRDETSLTRQLRELVHYFRLVDYDRAVLGKRSVLYISHPLVAFWFRFVQPNLSMYEFDRERLWKRVKNGMGDYVGKRFDFACRELLLLEELPFKPVSIGRHWGYYREKGVRKVYEID